ncbi:redoxin domain-containing protein [Halomicroarcula sp. F28]|uniref:redoxin domain-containing protein n=1 Tax=Haloarcula salinisoli TaxID=2487746 RepID=UPI001C733B21|nr:redoxin domain-containing protein [Halomicroarcula salinisoli]MBX0286748.1 redoxin domain-containing protein [Halomicroarcula salinisoli]
MNERESHQFDFELPNVGRGGETVQCCELLADSNSLLVVLLGSHYCSRSRELVRVLSERHDAFRRRDTAVVPVLPDIRERARLWDQQYDLPFPMLVDPATDGDSEQATERDDTFETFGSLQQSVGSLPAVALCRAGDDGLRVVATATEAELDVPVVESLLGFLDRHRAADATSTGNTPVDS